MQILKGIIVEDISRLESIIFSVMIFWMDMIKTLEFDIHPGIQRQSIR
jgi:hypothetical protein